MLPILLTLTAAYAILTWSDLHKGLLLLVAVLPSYLLRAEIFGVPTTLLEMLVVTFLVVWGVKRRSELIARSMFHVSRFTLPIALLLLAATIAVFVAPDRLAAIGIWKAYFLEPILLFFVIRHELTATKSQNTNTSYGAFVSSKIFQALGVSALILSLVAITQWLTGAGLPIPWDIERRVTSVFDYPNALGLFLGPIVMIAIMQFLTPPNPPLERRGDLPNSSPLHKGRSRGVWLIVAIISSIALVLAQSEAAIVSVVATLLIAGFLHQKTRVISSSLLLFFILLLFLLPPLFQKLTLQDYSGSVRLSQWSETFDMLGDHWLLGAGLSGYPTVFEPYHRATHLEIFQYPHNIVLNIWVELGVLGVIAVALLAWQVIVSSRPTLSERQRVEGERRDPSTSLGMTQTIAFLALLQMSIHGLVDVPYFKNDLSILTWILLAIFFSYARHTPPLSKTT
jgi:putative inorganic carbon (hco3(-)) transporter